jgi:S1-C subfamily serine protease
MDAAVLSCSRGSGSFDTAAVRVQPALTVGEGVFAIGNPLGLGWSYSRGAISAIRRYSHEESLLRMIQAQLPLNPGNSGGGLYDEAGALIGINTLTTAEGIGFALAICDLVPVLESQATLTLQKSQGSHLEAPLSP